MPVVTSNERIVEGWSKAIGEVNAYTVQIDDASDLTLSVLQGTRGDAYHGNRLYHHVH